MADIGVLLVDDNSSFVRSATRLLHGSGAAVVLGSVGSAEEALEQLDVVRPDLILMDISLPGMNGIEATRRLKELPGAPPVVIVTMYDDPEYREAALAAGADGYVVKAELGGDLIGTVMGLLAKRRVGTAAVSRGSET